jgi:hypothetical protein
VGPRARLDVVEKTLVFYPNGYSILLWSSPQSGHLYCLFKGWKSDRIKVAGKYSSPIRFMPIRHILFTIILLVVCMGVKLGR